MQDVISKRICLDCEPGDGRPVDHSHCKASQCDCWCNGPSFEPTFDLEELEKEIPMAWYDAVQDDRMYSSVPRTHKDWCIHIVKEYPLFDGSLAMSKMLVEAHYASIEDIYDTDAGMGTLASIANKVLTNKIACIKMLRELHEAYRRIHARRQELLKEISGAKSRLFLLEEELRNLE